MLAFEAVHWSTEIFVRFELTASQINPKSVCYMMHKFVSFLDIIHERSEVSQSMMGLEKIKSLLHSKSKLKNGNWVNKS